MSFDLPASDAIVATALAEDLGVPVEGLLGGLVSHGLLDRDATSASVIPADAHFAGVITAREPGVVCGLPLVASSFEMLARATGMTDTFDAYPLVAEGAIIDPGTVVLEVEGPARLMLAGERVALNFLMTLSGIATKAARWQAEAGESVQVVDTRKTLPGLRALSKYAVRVGGAHNHRVGLYDMVLIKDNHIRHAGGITAAVDAARAARPDLAIEVEADTIEQAAEAAGAGVDLVLLDNMDDATLRVAVGAVAAASERSGHRVLTEASGSIVFARLAALREIGVNRVSTSAITLASPLDFGLDEVNP